MRTTTSHMCMPCLTLPDLHMRLAPDLLSIYLYSFCESAGVSVVRAKDDAQERRDMSGDPCSSITIPSFTPSPAKKGSAGCPLRESVHY